MSAEKDINQVIESAVNARVEAEVARVLASDVAMQSFVVAALQTPVAMGSGYNAEKKPLVTFLVHRTIEEQAKAVVAEEIVRLEPAIRDEVRKALAKSIGVISDSLVDGFVANATGRYPSIKVEFSGRD